MTGTCYWALEIVGVIIVIVVIVVCPMQYMYIAWDRI